MAKRKHLTPLEAKQLGLKPATHWRPQGLMPDPGVVPAASVWQGQGAYPVYRRDQCVPWRHIPGPTESRRRDAAGWAREWIEGGAVVVDCESTGLEAKDEIVEICIMDVASGNTLLDTLVRPSRPISASAHAVHGITDNQVVNAPAWPQVQPAVANLLQQGSVLAYNASFDRRMLQQTAQQHGLILDLPRSDSHLSPLNGCIMRLFAQWWAFEGAWWKLTDAAEFCGAPTESAHRARADCCLARLLLHYVARHPRRRR